MSVNYKKIFEHIPSPAFIAVWDDRGYRIEAVNRLQRNLVCLPDDCAGNYIDEIYPSDLSSEIIKKMDECRFYGKDVEYAFQLPGLFDSVYRTVLIPVTGEDGGVESIVGVMKDATFYRDAQEKLRRSEEKYRNLISRIPDLVLVHVDGEIVFANESVEKVMGYQQSDISNSNVFQFIANVPDRNRAREIIQRRKGGDDVPEIYEIDLTTKWGSIISAEIRSIEIEFEGRPARLAIVTEITERKKSELMLRASEERFRNLAELLPECVYETDENGNVTFVNSAGLKMFGYKKKDISAGFHFSTLFDENEMRAFIRGRTNDPAGDRIRRTEYVGTHRNGSKIPVIFHTVPIMRDEVFGGTRGIIVDITERKKAENHVAFEKERLSVLFSSISDGLITLRQDNVITMINESACRMLGLARTDCLGRSLGDLMKITDAQQSEIHLNLVETAYDGRRCYDHVTMRTARGDISAEMTLSPLILPGDSGFGAVIVFADIAEKLKAEENKYRSVKLESLGILAGGIAHDFNNILTSIVGNISLARALIQSDDGVTEILSEAENASMKAKGLTYQLLTLSKGGDPVRKSVSIQQLIFDSVSFILRGTPFKAEFDLDTRIPFVEIDESQISQVLDNLVINAMQAMPEGGSICVKGGIQKLREGNLHGLAQGEYVRVSVIDTGCGIKKEDLPRIFDPYFTTKSTGHGLGLATSYSIIKKHGGCMEVDSSEGRTVFSFYLPAIKAANPRKKEGKKIMQKENIRILVLEDEESICKLLAKVFRNMSYDCTITVDGRDSIREYGEALNKGRKFDVVMLDLTVPGGLGGKETISELMRLDPDVRAIVCSGYSNDPVIANYREHGFRSFILKPYLIDNLGKVISETLQ